MIEKTKVDENTRRYEQRLAVEKIIDNMSGKSDREKMKAQNDYVSKQELNDRIRINKEFNELWKYQDIPDRRWWLNLKHMPPEARATVYWERLKELSPVEQKDMDKQAMRLPGIYTKGAFENKLYLLKKPPKK